MRSFGVMLGLVVVLSGACGEESSQAPDVISPDAHTPDADAPPRDQPDAAPPSRDAEPEVPNDAGSVPSGVVVNREHIVWSDQIQSDHRDYGWSGAGTEGSGSLNKIANPIGDGFAIEHQLDLPQFGRAQMGLWGQNAILQHPDGVWIAQRIYFPAELHTTSEWLSINDHHATSDGNDRWHTQPGFMLYNGTNPEHRMKLWDAWHGSGLGDVNHNLSDVALPVGRAFWLEYHYLWTTEPRAIPVYLDGVQIWQTTAQPTHAAHHNQAEHYVKWYGAGNWTPTPARRYTLEVLMSNAGRIVRAAGEP